MCEKLFKAVERTATARSSILFRFRNVVAGLSQENI